MKIPIIKAWEKSDGFLPEIHKAAIKVAYEFNDKYKKIQNPENWYLQMAKLANIDWPPSPETMDDYKLGFEPSRIQRSPEKMLKEMGHHPYRAKQPNGWSDISVDWMSPELLIRRLVYGSKSYYEMNANDRNENFYEKLVMKNFENYDQVLNFINKKNNLLDKHTLIFNHPEFLKA